MVATIAAQPPTANMVACQHSELTCGLHDLLAHGLQWQFQGTSCPPPFLARNQTFWTQNVEASFCLLLLSLHTSLDGKHTPFLTPAHQAIYISLEGVSILILCCRSIDNAIISKWTWESTILGKSLIKMVKRIWPSKDPCGTMDVTLISSDFALLNPLSEIYLMESC